MKNYLDLLEHILKNGETKTDRTGVGTISTFGYQMRFNLQEGFPLVTTRKIHLKSVIHELLWFISGDTNVKYLQDNGVKIWDKWVKEDNTIGKGYQHQWRHWPDGKGGTIDQITQVIERIKTKPDDRRLIVSAWNVADIPEMALPPCHAFFQFYVNNMSESERILWARDNGCLEITKTSGRDGVDEEYSYDPNIVPSRKLSCQLYQRSTDSPVGLCFNIPSYSLLTMMIAQVCGLGYGEFVWTGGDNHIYLDQVELVKEQLTRKPYPLPKMKINPNVKNIFDFKYEDFELVGYHHHPHIPYPVAV